MTKKTMIVYVTRTGNCKAIAEKVATFCDGMVVEIVDQVDRSGKIGFIKAGASSARGEASPISYPSINFDDFDNVILVQPMWALSICPPMRTWLNENKDAIKDKKIGMIVSCFGKNADPIRTKFEKNYYKLKEFCSIAEKLQQKEKDEIMQQFMSSFDSE